MQGYGNDPTDLHYRAYRNQVCRQRAVAMQHGFAGGLNYLPVDNTATMDDGRSEPDWDSIMLCELPDMQIQARVGGFGFS
jgi:hypothetical protein